MQQRMILAAISVVLSICAGAAPAQAAPWRPSSAAVTLLPARPIPPNVKALVSRWVKSPPAKIAQKVARKQISNAANTWLDSEGTTCVFPLPKTFCAPPARQWGLGQALRSNGSPPGVWSSPFSKRYQVTAPLVVGEVYSLTCWKLGERVYGPYSNTKLWYRVTSGGYVSDALLFTGTNDVIPGVSRC